MRDNSTRSHNYVGRDAHKRRRSMDSTDWVFVTSHWGLMHSPRMDARIDSRSIKGERYYVYNDSMPLIIDKPHPFECT